MRHIGIILIATLFYSCSYNLDKRLEQIEKDYAIKLTTNFDVIQDDDISYNGFESDYEQIVKIKFESSEFDSIKGQIEKSSYFNELGNYENNSMVTNEKPSYQHQLIIDSLRKAKQTGAWIIKEDQYVFLYFGDWMDFVEGNLNLSDKTLTWNHHHL